MNPGNFLQFAIRQGETAGIPLEMIVILLLFPVVATVIATARHFIGLRGFGIFTPAVVSVAFLATGLRLGLTLFLGILLIAVLARLLVKRLRLQYMPNMAMVILVISLGMLLIIGVIGGISRGAPYHLVQGGAGSGFAGREWEKFLGLDKLATVGIFPILLLVLLTETFISVQISHGLKRAATTTVETLVLATISYSILSLQVTRDWVLARPELTVLLTILVNIFLGRFTGLRLLEYWRFRELIRK